nr:MAG TPA: hypothetical protein [Caudoviricetes sp.]
MTTNIFALCHSHALKGLPNMFICPGYYIFFLLAFTMPISK